MFVLHCTLLSVLLLIVYAQDQCPPPATVCPTTCNCNCNCGPATPSPEPVLPICPSSEPVPGTDDLKEDCEIWIHPTINATIVYNETLQLGAGSPASMEDVYLVTDATNSMENVLEAVKNGFMQLVESRTAVSESVMFGTGWYRDEQEDKWNPDSDEGFMHMVSMTKDYQSVLDAISTYEVGPGRFVANDSNEAALTMMHKVATKDIGWREEARKVLIYTGDNPGHEPVCLKEGLVLTRGIAISELNTKGITVVAINVGRQKINNLPDSYLCEDPEDANAKVPGGQATEITQATNGTLLTQGEELEQTILDLLDSMGDLSQVIDADTSECEENGVHVTFAPPMPITLEPEETADVQISVTVTDEVCKNMPKYKCTVQFTSSGAPYMTRDYVVLNAKGC